MCSQSKSYKIGSVTTELIDLPGKKLTYLFGDALAKGSLTESLAYEFFRFLSGPPETQASRADPLILFSFFASEIASTMVGPVKGDLSQTTMREPKLLRGRPGPSQK